MTKRKKPRGWPPRQSNPAPMPQQAMRPPDEPAEAPREAMMAEEFYNPYQFLPIEGVVSDKNNWPLGDGLPSREAFDKDAGRLSHAAYVSGTRSGRIVCRLTLDDPLFIGTDRREVKDGYTRVEPYTIGGEPAIPASSLRGLISSLAEAASDSALRVLHDKRPVSWRVPVGRGLSAIGMLKKKEDGTFSLLPLCAPHIAIVHSHDSDYKDKTGNNPALEEENGDCYYFASHAHPHQAAWRKIFGENVVLKSYIGTYHEQRYRNGRPYDPNIDFGKTVYLDSQEKFWETVKLESRSFNPETDLDKPYFYMRVGHAKPLVALAATQATDSKLMKKGRTVIGRRAEDEQRQTRDQPYRRDLSGAVRTKPAAHFERGLIRILGVQDRDMAQTKKHEIFIPFPGDSNPRLLPIKREAIEEFEALAKEAAGFAKFDVNDNALTRLRKARPYLPFGTVDAMRADRRPEKDVPPPGVPKLRDGQLVFFDIEAEGGEPVVTRISFSSIWRGGVKGTDGALASMADFFPAEKRPMNPKRETISPAEALFGFVSDPADEKQHARNAYAGRVRFSAARLAEGVPEGGRDKLFCPDGTLGPSAKATPPDPPGPNYVRLKILSAPKPPCPAMYFNRADGKLIAKNELAVGGEHKPNGRKVYLHRERTSAGPPPWMTQHPDADVKQKTAIRPLDPGACNDAGGFWFHIDFDNLSEAELDLLCFALSPTADFRHKLGMGKPIGLGGVHIRPMALLTIDRKKRYTDGADVFGERYHAAWSAEGELPARWYQREMAARAAGLPSPGEPPRQRAEAHAGRLTPAMRNAIKLTGEPGRLKSGVPVHYPLSLGQPDDEDETFKWFVANADKKGSPSGQTLPHIGPDDPELKSDAKLPSLKKNTIPKRKG